MQWNPDFSKPWSIFYTRFCGPLHFSKQFPLHRCFEKLEVQFFFFYFQQCKCVIWISTFRTNDGHISVPIKHIAREKSVCVCELYYDFVIIYLVCWYVLTVIVTYLKAFSAFRKIMLKIVLYGVSANLSFMYCGPWIRNLH